jgi:hypothetical protein
MYREARGSISHPHRAETLTLSDLMVKDYARPEWTFNKLVYIEKEGANEALKAVGWPERHDCAVMSSKGFSTRAARDLIDKLAEHDEPVQVFCAHDADGYGTIIYQTLQEETKARKARKIQIINIGLEPWEAVEMGLEVETVKVKRNKAGEPIHKPVAGRWLQLQSQGRFAARRLHQIQFLFVIRPSDVTHQRIGLFFLLCQKPGGPEPSRDSRWPSASR